MTTQELTLSTFRCPCCNKPLAVEREGASVMLYCPWSPCESIACNQPHTAPVEAQALAAMEHAYEHELSAEAQLT